MKRLTCCRWIEFTPINRNMAKRKVSRRGGGRLQRSPIGDIPAKVPLRMRVMPLFRTVRAEVMPCVGEKKAAGNALSAGRLEIETNLGLGRLQI